KFMPNHVKENVSLQQKYNKFSHGGLLTKYSLPHVMMCSRAITTIRIGHSQLRKQWRKDSRPNSQNSRE
ncbi:MAG TPA: hypothetical protein V6C63_11990, partial [Allocoleopsis sp.]